MRALCTYQYMFLHGKQHRVNEENNYGVENNMKKEIIFSSILLSVESLQTSSRQKKNV